MGISNVELLRKVLDDIDELTRRGVIEDTVTQRGSIFSTLQPILKSELLREEEISASEGPDEHDPAEPRL